MKKYIYPLLAVLLLSTAVQAQRSTETKTLTFQSNSSENTFHLYNIHGSVEITTHSGSEIIIEVDKQFQKKSRSRSDIEAEDLKVVYDQEGNHITAYIEGPGIEVKRYNKNNRFRLGYNMNDWWNKHRVDFEFNFTVKVPRNIKVDVSTINDGFVRVENITSGVRASNVNGDIRLVNIAGTANITTVNGDIDASFTQQPSENSSFQTVNGDIEAYFPSNFSADIKFKALNGDMYTDFPEVTRLSSRVSTSKGSRRSGGTRYKINTVSPLRFGGGGPEHQFEVLNGNVYIKQRKL